MNSTCMHNSITCTQTHAHTHTHTQNKQKPTPPLISYQINSALMHSTACLPGMTRPCIPLLSCISHRQGPLGGALGQQGELRRRCCCERCFIVDQGCIVVTLELQLLSITTAEVAHLVGSTNMNTNMNSNTNGGVYVGVGVIHRVG